MSSLLEEWHKIITKKSIKSFMLRLGKNEALQNNPTYKNIILQNIIYVNIICVWFFVSFNELKRKLKYMTGTFPFKRVVEMSDERLQTT